VSSLELGNVSGLFWLHVVLSLTAVVISLYPFIHLNNNNQNKQTRLASLFSTTPSKDVVPSANILSDILDENKHQDDDCEPVPNILNHATN
jgi:hypothetical protein